MNHAVFDPLREIEPVTAVLDVPSGVFMAQHVFSTARPRTDE